MSKFEYVCKEWKYDIVGLTETHLRISTYGWPLIHDDR